MERRPITVTTVTAFMHQRAITENTWLSFTRSNVSIAMRSMVVSHSLQTLHSFDSMWPQPIMNMFVISVGTCLHPAKAYTDIRQSTVSVDMCVYPVTETFQHCDSVKPT